MVRDPKCEEMGRGSQGSLAGVGTRVGGLPGGRSQPASFRRHQLSPAEERALGVWKDLADCASQGTGLSGEGRGRGPLANSCQGDLFGGGMAWGLVTEEPESRHWVLFSPPLPKRNHIAREKEGGV